MNYQRKYFDPFARGSRDDRGNAVWRPERGGVEDLYVFAPRVILALNVAIATGRPLLVSGEPGCGKSSLARAAAGVLGYRYYARTVTSRTQAAELLWTFDALRRLNDATKQSATLKPDQQYVEPGPLWWAFDRQSALRRGRSDSGEITPATDPWSGAGAREDVVVLIDEIDKADPDVPNDLLEAFDRKTFTVRETGDAIAAGTHRLLMVLTTNRERAMPRAFLRRCVTLELDPPTAEWLEQIAERRYDASAAHGEIAREVMALRTEAKRLNVREPSTAEYLDAVVAARELGADRNSDDWLQMKQALLWKSDVAFPVGSSSGSGG